jgi:hypothetical protein
MHIPVGHEKNVFPTVQFIAADDVLDDSAIPVVELISGGSVLEGGTELGGGVLEGGAELGGGVLESGAELGGGVLEGGAEFEPGMPSRTLSYVEFGYKS